MYPQDELSRLAARKVALRASIAEQRALCANAASYLARPLGWFDECRLLWLGASPFVALTRMFFRFLRR